MVVNITELKGLIMKMRSSPVHDLFSSLVGTKLSLTSILSLFIGFIPVKVEALVLDRLHYNDNRSAVQNALSGTGFKVENFSVSTVDGVEVFTTSFSAGSEMEAKLFSERLDILAKDFGGQCKYKGSVVTINVQKGVLANFEEALSKLDLPALKDEAVQFKDMKPKNFDALRKKAEEFFKFIISPSRFMVCHGPMSTASSKVDADNRALSKRVIEIVNEHIPGFLSLHETDKPRYDNVYPEFMCANTTAAIIFAKTHGEHGLNAAMAQIREDIQTKLSEPEREKLGFGVGTSATQDLGDRGTAAIRAASR